MLWQRFVEKHSFQFIIQIFSDETFAWISFEVNDVINLNGQNCSLYQFQFIIKKQKLLSKLKHFVYNTYTGDICCTTKSMRKYNGLKILLDQSFRYFFFGNATLIESIFSGMPKNTYIQEALASGLEAVRTRNMSQRKAARCYGVQQVTLSDHLLGKTMMGAKAGRKPVLPREVEEELVDEALHAADKAFGISRVQLMMRAGRIAKEAKIKTGLKNDIPGTDWWLGLKKRHPRLVFLKPEGTASSRLKGLDFEKVGCYFEALVTVLQELQLQDQPQFIWHCDESNFSLTHTPTAVCAM